MGELDKTIAVVFKRGGKNVMSEMEFVNNVILQFPIFRHERGVQIGCQEGPTGDGCRSGQGPAQEGERHGEADVRLS